MARLKSNSSTYVRTTHCRISGRLTAPTAAMDRSVRRCMANSTEVLGRSTTARSSTIARSRSAGYSRISLPIRTISSKPSPMTEERRGAENFVAHVTRTSAGTASEGSSSVADTSHDFDFNYGTWTTHIKSLQQPAKGPASWDALTGTVALRKIMERRAFLEEITAGNAKTSFTGLTLYLYDRKIASVEPDVCRQQRRGVRSADDRRLPRRSRRQLIGPDTNGGKAVLMRDAWSDITPNAHHSRSHIRSTAVRRGSRSSSRTSPARGRTLTARHVSSQIVRCVFGPKLSRNR